MATTGHRSTRTVRGYIEDGQLFDDPSGPNLAGESFLCDLGTELGTLLPDPV